MNSPAAARTNRGTRGSTLVEFGLCAFLLMMLLFAIIDIARMVLIYNTMSMATRAGVRYAIVHGAHRTGSGVDGESCPGQTTQIETLVKNVASAGLLDTSRLTVTVSYLDGSKCGTGDLIGDRVKVTAQYTYDAFNTFFTSLLSVNLASTTQGNIMF